MNQITLKDYEELEDCLKQRNIFSQERENDGSVYEMCEIFIINQYLSVYIEYLEDTHVFIQIYNHEQAKLTNEIFDLIRYQVPREVWRSWVQKEVFGAITRKNK